MKKTLSILSAMTLGLAIKLGAAEHSPILNNAFSLTGDFAYYKRELGNLHKLVIDNSTRNCNCRFPSCNSKDLTHGFSFEPGYKVAATYATHRSVWDLSYLWIHHWEKQCSRHKLHSIIFSVKNPGITFDFNGADSGSAEYSTRFQNIELNYFGYVTPRHGNYFSAAYILGLRYMTLREALDVSFIKALDKSSYRVHTMNHIPAIQVGWLLAWLPTRYLTWDLFVKVGVGFDAGKQKTFLGDLNNTVTVRDYEKRGFSPPFLAEGDIRLTYQPIRYFNIHAAYQFIYLSGVALAPDQLVKSNSPRHVYRANGAPLIHGLTTGITLSY